MAEGARRAIGRGALLGAAVGTLLTLAVATAPEAAEKTLVYTLDGEPESLDSAKASSERSTHVTWLLCDALVNMSRDGQRVEPSLAESWTLSPDGRRATFKLRSGAVFHDGTPVNARAVKVSFDRQFRPGSDLYTTEPRNAKEQMLRELIDEIQIADDSTIVFRLKYPGLHYLSQIDVISSTAGARLGAEFARRPICSGPFRFESWSRDQLVLVANDRYWAGRPRIDRVIFRITHEPKAIVDALVKGQSDFTPTLRDTTYLERVRESAQVNLVPVSGLNVYYLGFYTERPPFTDRLLRQAVTQAVNVPRAVLFLGRGAAVAARGPLPPAVHASDPSVAQAPYDPEAAKQLLTRAGYASGVRAGLVHNDSITVDAEIATAVQGDLRRIGIDVQLLGKPTWSDFSAAVRAREGNMFLYSWHVRAPYPERILVPLFHSRAAESTNLTRYNSPAIDRLLDEALRLPDGPDQRKLYARAQKLIVEDAPMVFLYHWTRMAAVGGRVRGLELDLGAKPSDKLVNVDLAR